MSNFIFVGNQAINLDHVTDVKFSESVQYEGDEENDNKPWTAPASIDLVMTSLRIEESSTHEGDVLASASVSRIIEFRGETAEKIWQQLKQDYASQII